MDITQNFESDSPRHCLRFKYQVNSNGVFLSRTYKFECCMPSGSSSKARRLECQLNGKLQVDICTKESCILLEDFDQGFFFIFLIQKPLLITTKQSTRYKAVRSRIAINSLGERLLFRAWNFPRSKQASSQ